MAFVGAVKFILGTLNYIAEVVVPNGGQENGTMEDNGNSEDDEVDSEMQELMDGNENVFIVFFVSH